MKKRGSVSCIGPRSARRGTLGLAVGLLAALGTFAPARAAVPILWQGSYGGNGADKLTCALATEDGGCLLGGYSYSNPSGSKTAAQYDTRYEQFWIVKVDSSGTRQWDQSYWGGHKLNAMARATGVGYLLGGDSTSGITLGYGGAKGATNWGASVLKDFWIICVSTNGTRLWDQSYGGAKDDSLTAMAVMPDGGYLLGGSSYSGQDGNKTAPNYGDSDYWVVRTDASGNKLWDRSYGGDSQEQLTCLVAVPGGGALLGGTSLSGASGNKTAQGFGGVDFWLVRIDASGSKVWERAYGGSGYDYAAALAAVPGDGFVVAGTSSSPVGGGKTAVNYGRWDGWVLRLREDGTPEWDATFGGDSGEELNAVALAADSGFLLAGNSGSAPSGNKSSRTYGSADAWVVNVDAQGVLRWEQSIGGSASESFGAVLPAAGGGFLLAGSSYSAIEGNKTAPSFGGLDYWLVKIAGSTPPVIEQQPQGAVASGGTAASLTVSATSFTQPLRYQWRFNGTDLLGATNATLTLTNVQPNQAGPYTVLVSNGIGSVESQAAVLSYTDAASLELGLRASIAVYGTVGRTYRVEFAPKLSKPLDWKALGQITLTNTPQVFVDTQALLGERFYRVVLGP